MTILQLNQDQEAALAKRLMNAGFNISFLPPGKSNPSANRWMIENAEFETVNETLLATINDYLEFPDYPAIEKNSMMLIRDKFLEEVLDDGK